VVEVLILSIGLNPFLQLLAVALLEALARGQPVLASRDTNIEMLPEWNQLEPLVTFLADPSDVAALEAALENLLDSDPGITAASARIVAHYHWDALIEEYLEPIESLFARIPTRDTRSDE